ncbi:MAG TPA: ABC-2 family transporter protein [Verrucomicrobiae bacterium]|nr:ABC-2 family transporter protein [Verrucomicrobiae bacterium]
MKEFRRYLGLYVAFWKNSVAREMGFKANFFMWIITEALWFTLQLAFIVVIYQHTDRIADWSKWEVVLLMGAAHFIQQVFQAFFLTNCTSISEHVRTGKFDFMLLLPVNTRFLISLRQVDLGGYFNAASAVAVMIYALWQLHRVPAAAEVLGFLLLALIGVLIHYSFMFLLAGVSFWTVRAQGVVWAYYSMFNIARLPDSAFRGAFRLVFTFAIPMLLVANVPARVLAEKLRSPRDILLLLVMLVVAFLLSQAGWRISLKRYTSASS